MQKIYNVIIYLIIFNSFALHSQYRISGKILDEQGTQIDFSEIDLLKGDQIVNREISEEDGSFSIEGTAGEYSLNIHRMGKVLYDTVFYLNQNIYLGSIYTDVSHTLQEVVVSEYRPIIKQKVDRLIYNVNNDKFAQGQNVLEILPRVPRLEVMLDNSIKMAGKASVIIMINGRIQHMSGEALQAKLQSLRSDEIETIEVIPMPPSRYQSDGNSGMINIILKNDPNSGLKGTANSLLSFNKYWGKALGANVGYRINKLEVLASGNMNYAKHYFDNKDESDFISEPKKISTINHDNWNLRTYTFSGAINYDPFKQTKLGVSTDYTIFTKKGIRRGENEYYNKLIQQNDSVIHSETNSKNNPDNTLSIMAYWDQLLDNKGKKWSFTYNYFQKIAKENSDIIAIVDNYEQEVDRNKQMVQDNRYRIHSLFGDLELPTSWAKIETGASYTNISNLFDINTRNSMLGRPLTLDSLNTNSFEYKEQTSALYLSINKTFTSQWSGKIGIRYEYTNLETYSPNIEKSHTDQYGYFLPTFFLMYCPNEQNKVSLSLAKRIQRPNFRSLDPFRYYSNIYSYSSGNPNLKPSSSYNAELNYTYKNNLNITLYGTRNLDMIDNITQFEKGTEIQSFIPYNLYNQTIVGLIANYTLNLARWWRIQFNGNTSYSNSKSFKADAGLNSVSGWKVDGSIRNSFTLNTANTLLFELYYAHSFPSTVRMTKWRTYGYLSANLNYYLLGRTLMLSLRGSDLARKGINRATTQYKDYTHHLKIDPHIRQVSISVQYTFGNSSMKGINKKHKVTEVNRL